MLAATLETAFSVAIEAYQITWHLVSKTLYILVRQIPDVVNRGTIQSIHQQSLTESGPFDQPAVRWLQKPLQIPEHYVYIDRWNTTHWNQHFHSLFTVPSNQSTFFPQIKACLLFITIVGRGEPFI